ncbi:hypothetical protein E2562_032279 [Oryza meyeriana var. granulata]|uniref:Uncharacterized protein n=1 Tax=Oryza meyeriana var. granulata TaxID=110450 RepID=A0A6G1F0J1_9ORYZ|nr:hypothetical protein E2562_032279 [Oryza meyeriana var. granulata]
MKKKGKMSAKVKKITFTGSQMECKITLADSQDDSQAPSSTDLAARPSAQTQSRDAQKPPIMKKTCRKRKVDSDDSDELKPFEGTCYYHDDFDREVEPRGGNHGNPWPEELIWPQRINFPSLFDVMAGHLDAISIDQRQAVTEALQMFDN